MKHRPTALSILTLALGLFELDGCAAKSTQVPRSSALVVEVARAERQTISTELHLDGQVAPLQDSTLSIQQSGPLVGMYANEGQHVGAGALLAKVDDSALRAQLQQVHALIAQAAAKAQGSALGVPITQQQTTGSLQAAQNLVSADRAALTNATTVYSSNQQLYAQGYVAKTALIAAGANLVSAQQRLQTDQQAIVTAQGNTQQTGVSEASALADRAGVQAQMAQAHILETAIAQTSLYAPFSGTITQRLMDLGAMAGPQLPTFRLSQVNAVYINVNVPEADLPYVHSGSLIHFSATALPGRLFQGTIQYLNALPTAGTLSYRARLRVANPQGDLHGGMIVAATTLQERHDQALVVPRAAILQNERGDRVFLVQHHRAKEVGVTLGLQTDTLSEIRSSEIHPGTRVIVVRPDALHDGSNVTYAHEKS